MVCLLASDLCRLTIFFIKGVPAFFVVRRPKGWTVVQTSSEEKVVAGIKKSPRKRATSKEWSISHFERGKEALVLCFEQCQIGGGVRERWW